MPIDGTEDDDADPFHVCAGFLGLCGFLLILLAYEVFAPIPEWQPDAPGGDVHPPQMAATYPFIAPSAEAFAIIDARPVFNPLRTPLQASNDISSGTGSVTLGDLSLIGIILDHGTRIALLRTPGKPLAVAVTAGTAIDGWQVVSIGSDRITVRANGSEQDLLLSANKPPAQAAPAVPPGEAQ